MIHDAEQYREDDERARERVNTRNRLEIYTYSCKQAIQNYNGSTLSKVEKTTVLNACEETQRWLDKNQSAERDEIDHQYKILEKKCQKIMSKIHSNERQQHSRNDHGNHSGPRVEEVD